MCRSSVYRIRHGSELDRHFQTAVLGQIQLRPHGKEVRKEGKQG